MFNFTKNEEDYLINNCNFNSHNGELEIFKLKCDGLTRTEISFKTGYSLETVTRRTNNIKDKIKRVL